MAVSPMAVSSALSSVPRAPLPRPLVEKTARKVNNGIGTMRKCSARRVAATAAAGKPSGGELALIATGALSNPIVLWSEFTLKTTGCGLPPGPGGVVGALEGVSYLAIVGIIGLSLYTKVKTGKGLDAGPFGLVGAVEGLSYLSAVVGLVVLGFQIYDNGYIPSAVPDDKCFG